MSNKQFIFTILLIFFIIMLIYYINNIPSDIKNTTESEHLTNSSVNNVEEEEDEDTENNKIIDEIINNDNSFNYSNSVNEGMTNLNSPQPDNQESELDEESVEAEPEPEQTEESNQVVDEQEVTSEESDKIDTKITLKEEESGKGENSNLSSQVFNFKGNDLASTSGAPLNNAFNVLVNNKSKDKVDFKRNNVDKYDANDYLPKEINDDWFQTDFTNAKTVDDDSLINIKPHTIGVNTVGQSLKNASHDIRGTIANPKFSISPWNNSTYESDWNIKSLC